MYSLLKMGIPIAMLVCPRVFPFFKTYLFRHVLTHPIIPTIHGRPWWVMLYEWRCLGVSMFVCLILKICHRFLSILLGPYFSWEFVWSWTLKGTSCVGNQGNLNLGQWLHTHILSGFKLKTIQLIELRICILFGRRRGSKSPTRVTFQTPFLGWGHAYSFDEFFYMWWYLRLERFKGDGPRVKKRALRCEISPTVFAVA